MGAPLLPPEDIVRLPCGQAIFADIRSKGKIYVDKTGLLYKLALGDCPYFLSRPRRFGKSLLISTFESLFSKGLADFRGLAIEKLWHEDKTYPVAHLTFANYDLSDIGLFRDSINDDLKDNFGAICHVETHDAAGRTRAPANVFRSILRDLGSSSVVILIDEYDSPIIHTQGRPELCSQITETLSAFFNVLKDFTGRCRFIFITGITRISHVSLFSVFNNLTELTLTRGAACLTGFTEEELHRYFHPYVENAAAMLDMTVDDVYSRLKTRYDGYRFTLHEGVDTLYNPWSVLSFLSRPEEGFENYWYHSGAGTPKLLIEHLKRNAIHLDYAAMKHNPPTVIKDRLISKSEAINIPEDILLWQTGYYTLAPVNPEMADLVMPNEEIEDSVTKLIEDINSMGLTKETYNRLFALPGLIDAVDLENIQELFNDVLNECLTSDTKVFNYEPDIRNILYMKIPEKALTKLREHKTLHGESDLELKTHKTHLVIEFKRTYEDRDVEASLQEGIKQIIAKEYGKGSSDLALVRVVMVCDSKERKIVLTQRVD
ncbi:MAG: AAA family ATPase [Succinivibrio sp.]|nr:AAA family ATPase [Succinivibrio sp.]